MLFHNKVLFSHPHVAIATVVVFRNMCTVIIAIVDYCFFGNKFNKMQMASLGTTTIGMLVCAGQDINFDLMGYIWLVGNSVATIANTFWNKVFITKYTKELKIQTSYGVSLIQQLETLPIVFVLTAVNGEGGVYMEYKPLDMAAKLTILATCAGGVLIGIAYPKCFSLLSGTSAVVASTVNKAVSIVIGMVLFGTRLSVECHAGIRFEYMYWGKFMVFGWEEKEVKVRKKKGRGNQQNLR